MRLFSKSSPVRKVLTGAIILAALSAAMIIAGCSSSDNKGKTEKITADSAQQSSSSGTEAKEQISKAADSVGAGRKAQIEKMMADFSQQSVRSGKVTILKKLLRSGKENSYLVFYSLLAKSAAVDSGIFKEAFDSAKSVEAYLYLGKYVKNSALDEIASGSGLSDTGKAEIYQKWISSMAAKMMPDMPAIKVIAKNNVGKLVSALRNNYRDSIYDPIIAWPAICGLAQTGEKGFSALLDSAVDNIDGARLTTLVSQFGPCAVIPTFKVLENPASSEFKRTMAKILVDNFSLKIAEVIDKIVEAYKHGRYFAVDNSKSDGTVSGDLDRMFQNSQRWWGNDIKQRLKGDQPAVRYIAEKYLSQRLGQATVIELIAAIDFGTAKPYLEKLDPKNLSRESREALFLACHSTAFKNLITGNTSDDPFLDDKFSFFRGLFLKCSKEQRVKQLFQIGEYPPEAAAEFLGDNFSKFTGEEKNIAIFKCGNGDGYHPGFSQEIRENLAAKISPYCNDQQKKLIKFELEQ